MSLFFRAGQVLGPARNDDKFSGTDLHFSLDTVFEIAHPKLTLHHEEQLIFIIVMMPDKLALQLHDLYVRVVDLRPRFSASSIRRIARAFRRDSLCGSSHHLNQNQPFLTSSHYWSRRSFTLDAETDKRQLGPLPCEVKPTDPGATALVPGQLNFLQLSCGTLRIWLVRGRVPHEELV